MTGVQTCALPILEEELFLFIKKIEDICMIDKDFAVSIVETFSDKYILSEFFSCCPKAKIRRCVCQILKISIRTVYNSEVNNSENYSKVLSQGNSLLIHLINSLMSKLTEQNVYGEFFDIITYLINFEAYIIVIPHNIFDYLFDYIDFLKKENFTHPCLENLDDQYNISTLFPPKVIIPCELSQTERCNLKPYVYELFASLLKRYNKIGFIPTKFQSKS